MNATVNRYSPTPLPEPNQQLPHEPAPRCQPSGIFLTASLSWAQLLREIEKKKHIEAKKKGEGIIFSTRRFVNANWQLRLNEVPRDCAASALRGLIK